MKRGNCITCTCRGCADNDPWPPQTAQQPSGTHRHEADVDALAAQDGGHCSDDARLVLLPHQQHVALQDSVQFGQHAKEQWQTLAVKCANMQGSNAAGADLYATGSPLCHMED